MRAKRRTTALGALALAGAGLACVSGMVGISGCAEVPPLETPEEVEAMRAEWEAQAAADAAAAAAEAPAPEAAALLDDDYTIDVPPPYPVEDDTEGVSARRARGEDAGPGDEPTVIRIDKTGRSHPPRTLYEASREAQSRRKVAPKARIRIDNENLRNYQDGNVTIGSASPAEPEAENAVAEEGHEAAVSEETSEPERGEAYWRSTVLDLRLRLRSAVDELAELDDRAGDLRRSFYAQDDPYVRDGEIKPAWDRTLDRVEETRREILHLYRQLDTTLQDGRQAGALPGWLREGAELEPEPDELPRDRADGEHVPREPSVIEIEPREPPGKDDS